jgi:hypothetical protein
MRFPLDLVHPTRAQGQSKCNKQLRLIPSAAELSPYPHVLRIEVPRSPWRIQIQLLRRLAPAGRPASPASGVTRAPSRTACACDLYTRVRRLSVSIVIPSHGAMVTECSDYDRASPMA